MTWLVQKDSDEPKRHMLQVLVMHCMGWEAATFDATGWCQEMQCWETGDITEMGLNMGHRVGIRLDCEDPGSPSPSINRPNSSPATFHNLKRPQLTGMIHWVRKGRKKDEDGRTRRRKK